MSQEYTEVFRTGQSLSAVYYIYSSTITQLGKERSEVGMDREVRKNLL